MTGKEYAKKKKKKISRQRRKALLTREKILQAARELFSEKGLDTTSIDDITGRADVGKGSFYYHFKNKGVVIRTLISRMLKELEEAMEDRCRGITHLRKTLEALIDVHTKFFCGRWEDFVLFFQGRTELTLRESYQGIEAPFVEYLEKIETIIEPAVKAHLPEHVLRRIACAVAGMVSGYYSFAAVASDEADIDKAFRSLRGAMAASLARFIQETTPTPKVGERE